MKPSAYEVAKAGGRNKGIIRRFGNESEAAIQKSIRSLEKKIVEHEDKIVHPWLYVDVGTPVFHVADLVSRYWPNEIDNFRQQINVLNGILVERNNGPTG